MMSPPSDMPAKATSLAAANRERRDIVTGEVVQKQLALLLEGGGLGGGAAAEVKGEREWALATNGVEAVTALPTPSSPALPPSRGKGE